MRAWAAVENGFDDAVVVSNHMIRLLEYDTAFSSLLAQAAEGFAQDDPLLALMPRHVTDHRGPVRNVAGPHPLDQVMTTTVAEATIDANDIRNGDVDAHTLFVAELCNAFIAEQHKHFFSAADAICERTGAVHDTQGTPLSADVINDMLEKLPIRFGGDGSPLLPAIIVHPTTLRSLAPPTQEQEARKDAIIAAKRKAYVDSKRRRRLSRKLAK